jgi:hypothetical protein
MHPPTDVCLLLIARLYPCTGHDVTLSAPRRGFFIAFINSYAYMLKDLGVLIYIFWGRIFILIYKSIGYI